MKKAIFVDTIKGSKNLFFNMVIDYDLLENKIAYGIVVFWFSFSCIGFIFSIYNLIEWNNVITSSFILVLCILSFRWMLKIKKKEIQKRENNKKWEEVFSH